MNAYTAGSEEPNVDATLCAFFCFTARESETRNNWLLDSGASEDMCREKTAMLNLRDTNIKSITVANSDSTAVQGEGGVSVEVQFRSTTQKIRLKKILYVPKITSNLLFISCITQRGFNVSFEKKTCRIKNAKQQAVATATATQNEIYKLNGNKTIENKIQIPRAAPAMAFVSSTTSKNVLDYGIADSLIAIRTI